VIELAEEKEKITEEKEKITEEKEKIIEEKKETEKTAKDETYEEFMKRYEKPEFVIHWEGKKE
jgi:hypothetical protein